MTTNHISPEPNPDKNSNTGQTKTVNENPYKGLFPYEEVDNEMFSGRAEETEQLFYLVKFNLLSVVCGKSGIGKTSLLNAGLCFRLRNEGFLPIRLRLNYSGTEGAPSLLQQIRQSILSELERDGIEVKTHEVDEYSKPFAPVETLWEYFHRVSHFLTENNEKRKVIPVLVFDQFEEFFTLGKKHDAKDKDDFIDELYWLIENQFPEYFSERINREKNASFYTKKPDIRLIISLREDYLPHLVELSSRIPSIERVKFRVNYLNGKQARDIISIGFKEEKVINDILCCFYPVGVDKKIPDKKLEIEPAFLSLLCHQLFEKSAEDKNLLKTIPKEYKGKILEDFYDSVMKEFSEEVKEFLESKLLTEGGYRTPFYLEPTHRLRNEIAHLVNRRILRRFHVGEKEYIEIIHDVLATIIKEKRNKRLDEITLERLKKTIIRRYVIRVLSSAALIFAVIAAYAFIQKGRADVLYKNAQVNRLTAEALREFPKDSTKAIRYAEKAYKLDLPNPSPRISNLISAIGYSSFDTPFYITVLHHQGPVYIAEFSPDESRILTASEDGTAKIWTREGELLANVDKHKARIMSAAFSPDGGRIVTGSWDKTAKLWGTNGTLLVSLNEHKGAVLSVSFSPDGSRIVTASGDGTAKLWNLEGNLLANLDLQNNIPVSSARFSPDGRSIITASWDESVGVWDIKGNLIANLNKDKETTASVFLSHDGSRILTSLFDGTAKVLNLQGELLANIKHDGMVSSAGFSSTGDRIFTASDDGTVKVWDHEGHIVKYLTQPGTVTFSVFFPDESRLLIADENGTAKIWNLKSNTIESLIKHNGRIHSAAFSSDGSQVLTASEDGTGKVWELKNDIITDLDKHTDEVNNAVFSPDGQRILTASNDGTAKIWNLEGKLLKSLDKHKTSVKNAMFSPDGSRILTTSEDGAAKIWNIEGKLLTNLKKKEEEIITSAMFSANGNLILTVYEDNTIKIWDLQKNQVIDLGEHSKNVMQSVFSPDGSRILTAHKDGGAKLWDLDGKLLIDLDKHSATTTAAAFSPDGSRILTTYKDGRAKLWDIEGILRTGLIKHNQAITSALFSPDGRRILTSSEDDTVKIWNLEGELLADLNKHRGGVTGAVFSPNGQTVLTASDDGTVKLWNLQGDILANLNKHKAKVNSAVFSPDGQRILTASEDGTAKIWLTPEAIFNWLKSSKISRLSEKDKNNLEIKFN